MDRLLERVTPSRALPRAQVIQGWPAWWAIVGWFAGVSFASVGVAIAIASGVRDGGGVALLAGQLGLWAGFIGTAVIASRAFGTAHVPADFSISARPGDAGRAVLIGVALQLLVVPGIYLPLVALGVDLDVSGPAEALFDDVSRVQAILIALGVVVVAPVAEELLFRGVLLRGLGRRFGASSAIWISAVLFAATHFQLVQFPALLAVGLTLAWLADRTGGLGAPIWAHAGFNAVTVAMLW